MSLADELEALRDPSCCKVGKWLSEQPDTDQVAFHAWVEDGESRKALLRACQRAGLDCCWSTFSVHVAGHHEPR